MANAKCNWFFCSARLFLSLSSPSAECTRRQSRLKRRRVIKSNRWFVRNSIEKKLEMRDFQLNRNAPMTPHSHLLYLFALCFRNNVAHNLKRVSSFVLEITAAHNAQDSLSAFRQQEMGWQQIMRGSFVIEKNAKREALKCIVHYQHIQDLMCNWN